MRAKALNEKDEEIEIRYEDGLKSFKVKKPFEGKRITIAFDVSNENDLSESFKKNGNTINLSYIPII